MMAFGGQKHDDACLGRRNLDGDRFRFWCTCGFTDVELAQNHEPFAEALQRKKERAFIAEFSNKGFKDDESRP